VSPVFFLVSTPSPRSMRRNPPSTPHATSHADTPSSFVRPKRLLLHIAPRRAAMFSLSRLLLSLSWPFPSFFFPVASLVLRLWRSTRRSSCLPLKTRRMAPLPFPPFPELHVVGLAPFLSHFMSDVTQRAFFPPLLNMWRALAL